MKSRKARKNRKSKPVPVSDHSLRSLLSYNMKRSYLSIQHELLASLQKFELRLSTFSALLLICDNPDMTQSQLAQALNIERSGVVLLVDELENRGLISRNRVPTDRRSYALQATPAGTRLRDRAHQRIREREDTLLHGLSADERVLLVGLLERVEAGVA